MRGVQEFNGKYQLNISTKRIFMRKLSTGDIKQFYEIVKNNGVGKYNVSNTMDTLYKNETLTNYLT